MINNRINCRELIRNKYVISFIVTMFLLCIVNTSTVYAAWCGMCNADVGWIENIPHKYRNLTPTTHDVQRFEKCENGHPGNWNTENHTFKYGICIYCGYGTLNVPAGIIFGTSYTINIVEGETVNLQYDWYNNDSNWTLVNNVNNTTNSTFTVNPNWTGGVSMSNGRGSNPLAISIKGNKVGTGTFLIREYYHSVTGNQQGVINHNFELKSTCTVTVNVLSAHTHSWSWTYNDSQHWQVCSCGATQNTANHNYDTTVSSPTCTGNGTEKCSTCGKTRSTAALGHSMGSWYISVNETCTADGQNRRDCQRRLWVL